MRLYLRTSFLILYVAASYAVTQERAAVASDSVQRTSAQTDQKHIGYGGRHQANEYPQYRQAKPKPRATTELGLLQAGPVLVPPQFKYSSGVARNVVFNSLARLAGISSRAPPVQL